MRTSARRNDPSACGRNSNSSLWVVTFTNGGLNSMNGRMESSSSAFVTPFSGGTISIDGYGLSAPFSICEIFITYKSTTFLKNYKVLSQSAIKRSLIV